MPDHDSGDEDDYREPPLDPILELLFGDDSVEWVPSGPFVWAHYADIMRTCCAACAQEYDQDDGS